MHFSFLLYFIQIFKFKKSEKENRTLGAEGHSDSKECICFHSDSLHWKTMKTTCETVYHMIGIVYTDGITGSFTFLISKEN